jgi:hypothetical protein
MREKKCRDIDGKMKRVSIEKVDAGGDFRGRAEEWGGLENSL